LTRPIAQYSDADRAQTGRYWFPAKGAARWCTISRLPRTKTAHFQVPATDQPTAVGMKSRVHPKFKTKYRVTNWATCDQALVQRGDITLWITPEAI
jgi:hypothetical protein